MVERLRVGFLKSLAVTVFWSKAEEMARYESEVGSRRAVMARRGSAPSPDRS